VRDFTGGKSEILGEMRTQGGRVYFVQNQSSGKIEALRLEQKGKDEFALGFTAVLKPIVQSPAAPPPVQERPVPPAAAPRPAPPRPQPPPPVQAPVRPPSPPPAPVEPRPPLRTPPPPPKEDSWLQLARDLVDQPVVVAGLVASVILILLIVLVLVA
jgi:hypothetical protein